MNKFIYSLLVAALVAQICARPEDPKPADAAKAATDAAKAAADKAAEEAKKLAAAATPPTTPAVPTPPATPPTVPTTPKPPCPTPALGLIPALERGAENLGKGLLRSLFGGW